MLHVPSPWTCPCVWVAQLPDSVSEPDEELASTNKQKSASPQKKPQTPNPQVWSALIYFSLGITSRCWGWEAFDGKDLGSAVRQGVALSATELCDTEQKQAKHLPGATQIPYQAR